MGGLLNRNAIRAAAERLVAARGGVVASQELKRVAAERLVALFAEIGETPPPSLEALASSHARVVVAHTL
jgi:hypothetical protein